MYDDEDDDTYERVVEVYCANIGSRHSAIITNSLPRRMWSSSRASAKKKIILHTFERSSLAFGHIILFAKNIKVSDGRAFISNQITRRTLFPLSNLGCILNVPYQLGRTIRKAAIRHVEERDFILKRPCQPEVKRKVFFKNTMYTYI